MPNHHCIHNFTLFGSFLFFSFRWQQNQTIGCTQASKPRTYLKLFLKYFKIYFMQIVFDTFNPICPFSNICFNRCNSLLTFGRPHLYNLEALPFTYGQYVADKLYNTVAVCLLFLCFAKVCLSHTLQDHAMHAVT